MLDASETSVDALFEYAGVIRTETIGEMLDTAALLARQPLPRGDRVAIVSNGHGPGILCADACTAGGLRVDAFCEGTMRALAAALPPDASVGNPIDIHASAGAARLRARSARCTR
jgi:acyl-CoA synthetase (NDP forming)